MIFLEFCAPLNGGKRKFDLHASISVIAIILQAYKYPIRALTSQTDLHLMLK